MAYWFTLTQFRSGSEVRIIHQSSWLKRIKTFLFRRFKLTAYSELPDGSTKRAHTAHTIYLLFVELCVCYSHGCDAV